MLTRINKLHNDWTNIKNKCRTTVGKEYTDNVPNQQFKLSLLISEHSPIRLLEVDWSWSSIKSWIATHFSRHIWQCFISTRRSDRTGKDRNELRQDEIVQMDCFANAQHLIDTARKRLCYQASADSREYMEDLKAELMLAEPELGLVMVPNCVYRCGCPEFTECGFWQKCVERGIALPSIKDRYRAYNALFVESRVKK